MIPYGRQIIEPDDIQAVVDALTSGWLTTGPCVAAFESAFADAVQVGCAVSLSSGTAALHSAMYAIGVGRGDEVIVPSMTFAATANAVIYQGGTPVFVDVDPKSLLIDVGLAEEKITEHTKAIIAVDYGGQPCDYDQLRSLVKKYNLALVADACHSLGGSYKDTKVGGLADLTAFSFHPVKHITAGEGGMVATNDENLAERIRRFRNHGIATDHHARQKQKTWYYEMTDLGFNYRLTDMQCALAHSQLKKLPLWLNRRRELARAYDRAFAEVATINRLSTHPNVNHAYHLYAVRLALQKFSATRLDIFSELRAKGIGVNVHYIPVHLHPYYQNNYGGKKGDCPVAEQAYEELISLPMHAALTDAELAFVVESLLEIIQ